MSAVKLYECEFCKALLPFDAETILIHTESSHPKEAETIRKKIKQLSEEYDEWLKGLPHKPSTD
jgi:hypothetical protein